MQQVLKVSTAATTIVGPILDTAGAVYTGAVIGDLNITKNGTTAAMAAAATLTHDHNGHYLLAFTTGNTDTLGRLDITCNKSTYAMPPKVFEVLPATAFDAIVTNGTLASTTSGRTIVTDAAGLVDANTVKVGPTGAGTAQTAGDIPARLPAALGANGNIKSDVRDYSGTAGTFAAGRPEVNTTHIAGTAWASTTLFTLASHDPGATLGTSTLTQAQVTGGAYALNSSSFAFSSSLDFSTTMKTSIGTAVAASAVASVTGAVGSVASGGIAAASFAAGAITAAAIAADAIGASELAADAATEIATAVRDISNASPAASSLGAAVNTAVTNADNANSNATDARDNSANVYTRLGAPAGASVSADIAAVKADTGNLVTRITSGLFTGITSLAQWLGLIAGKQVGNTTARTELRATGAGSGTYDETTDSQEATKDAGVTVAATDIRSAIGMASANLDTQLALLVPGSAIDIDVEITETEVEDS